MSEASTQPQITINEEYTKLVRPLSEQEHADLKRSIEERGQMVPITINQDGVILDGHNRFRICQELGIPPLVIRREFKNKTVEKLYVIEANLKRRHLTDIEKVELGMQLEPIEAELARRRMSEGGKGVSNETPLDDETGEGDHEEKGRASKIVADRVGLSPTTYHRGKTVLKDAPDEVKDQVKSGAMSITAGYEKTKGKEKTTRKPRDGTSIRKLVVYENLFAELETALADARANGTGKFTLSYDPKAGKAIAIDVVEQAV